MDVIGHCTASGVQLRECSLFVFGEIEVVFEML